MAAAPQKAAILSTGPGDSHPAVDRPRWGHLIGPTVKTGDLPEATWGAGGPLTVKMSKRTVAFVAFSAALLGAAGAHAQTKAKDMDFTVRSEALPQGGKTLKWDMQNGRWGVTLDLDQPSGRDVQLNDVQAGAYFRVTPSLRVGGAVALGEKEEPAFKKTQPTESTPRVRLETALKF